MSSPTPSVPSTPTTATAEPRARPPPLPAVKGTMGGIESPRVYKEHHKLTPPATPLLTPAASREPTPAPSVAPAPVLVFRADPRMTTTFAALPDSAEVRHLFNV